LLFRFGTFGDDLQTEIMGKNNDDPDYLAATSRLDGLLFQP
jgi:hypothetical protein